MNDAHRRFTEWLLAGADDDLTRDLALHASVCPDCVRSVASIDLLASIDLERAGLPGPLPAGSRWHAALAAGMRVARLGGATVGAALVLVVVGGGAGPLLASLLNASPESGVLGATATPGATATMQQTASPDPGTPTASPSEPADSPTLEPTNAPFSPPVTPRPTPRPTARPTPVATPIATPVSTPTQTPIPTPTAVPTPSPTPGLTAPAAPTGLVAQSGPMSIGLNWTPPADGGSAITDYQVCRGIAESGPYDTCFSAGVTDTSYVDTDPALVGGQVYWYVVKAVNAIGISDPSAPASQVIS